MRPRLGFFSGIVALAMLGIRTARPDPVHPPERVRVSYQAPVDCPDQTAFESGVSERLNRPWRATPDELARTIRVVVTKEGGLLVARMAFTDARGRFVSRAVSAESCEEVVSGIALVTALAIQSQVLGEEPGTPAAPAASAVPDAPSATPADASPPPPPPPMSPPSAWTHDVGLQFGVAEKLGPHLAAGVGALWGLGPRSHPSFVRLAAAWYDTGTVDAGGGAVRFQMLAGRLELCPARLALHPSLLVPACAGLELGSLTAEGRDRPGVVVHARTEQRAWAAAVLAPRIRLELGRMFGELVAEERFPLVRRTFRFNRPGGFIHEIPLVAFGAVAAVGLRFP
jgi:hypothetical protein